MVSFYITGPRSDTNPEEPIPIASGLRPTSATFNSDVDKARLGTIGVDMD